VALTRRPGQVSGTARDQGPAGTELPGPLGKEGFEERPAPGRPAVVEHEGLLILDGVPVADFPTLKRRKVLATRRQKAVAGAVVVAALGLLLWKGLTNALDYYLTANQAVAQRAELKGSDFRVQGTVLPGLRSEGGKLYFTITSHNVDVHVVSTGSPPQLFRAGMPVVLDGHWQGDTFASFQIMVQHGATYLEAHRATS
jgi:cytochrome c-type biogenesis protein CcmE